MITSLTVNPNSNDSFKNSNMNALTNNNLWAFFHIEKVERSTNMNFPSREQVESIRRRYPPGTRIELLGMEDPYHPVPPGTKGTVVGVDDAGSIMMKWDNGRSLSLIPGEDAFRKSEPKAQKKNSHER